uniref:pentapeptide repeat-containing protein n=1 Tax=Methanolacinia paynteri TaxID=230356 RepID=UPI00069436DD|nr:pentapeptide repeat-containing protein [Methanolacinia paynteri]
MTDDTLRRFNKDHYDFLMKCSQKRDFTEWNEWHKEYRKENRYGAHLKGANFREAYLEGVNLAEADLEGCDFSLADLRGANLSAANLKDAILDQTDLRGADFIAAIVNEVTSLYDIKNSEIKCQIDNRTRFAGVALGAMRISPPIRTHLERNIRELYWKLWYKEHRYQKYVLRLFWWLSDYGTNTKRIIGTFFGINILFCLIYYFVLPPLNEQFGVTENIFNMTTTTPLTALIQSNMIVFSITDIATRNLNELAMLIVMFHIILGYFILAVLVTRLGIMYQSLSP